MGRKIERTATASGRGAVSSREIVSLIREGRLTRRQFDAWHLQRRLPVRGFVIAMHDSGPVSSRRAARRRHKKG